MTGMAGGRPEIPIVGLAWTAALVTRRGCRGQRQTADERAKVSWCCVRAKAQGPSESAPEPDSLARKFPDFDKLPRRPIGPILPGFTTVRSFWRGERVV